MMTRARAGLLLLGIFLLGALAGALATGAFVGFRVRHGGPRAERVERFVVERLARRLDLDASQRQTLEKIADRARPQIEQVRNEALPKVEAILNEAYAELMPTLRPEQQQKLEKIREEAQERLRRRARPR